MGYYANQKTVKINKPEVERGRAKIIVDREKLEVAGRELTGNEFKLYMFFASDNDGFRRDFSPAHFSEVYGVSADTTRKLFKQLEDKGFIKADENKKNFYQFYLLPQKKLKIKVPRKRIVDEDGVVYELTYEELCKELKGYSEETISRVWNSGEEI